MSPSTPSVYRSLLKDLALRVWWDLHPEAWQSWKHLREIKDSQAGRKIVILCNGPSVLKTDFEMLIDSGAYIIGLNKINLLFDKTDMRPDAIVAVNRHVIEQNAEFFNETDIPVYLSKIAIGRQKLVPKRCRLRHSSR